MNEKTYSPYFNPKLERREIRVNKMRVEVPADPYIEVDVRRIAHMVEQVVVTASRDIWSETLLREKIEYPSDWFQALKAHWLPKLGGFGQAMLSMWPVQLRTHEISWTVRYPDFQEDFSPAKGLPFVRVIEQHSQPAPAIPLLPHQIRRLTPETAGKRLEEAMRKHARYGTRRTERELNEARRIYSEVSYPDLAFTG